MHRTPGHIFLPLCLSCPMPVRLVNNSAVCDSWLAVGEEAGRQAGQGGNTENNWREHLVRVINPQLVVWWGRFSKCMSIQCDARQMFLQRDSESLRL